MQAADLIDPSASVTAFFRDAVEGAIRSRRCGASEASEVYLVGLLSDYAKPSAPTPRLEQPFTLQLQDALNRGGADRFERLRQLGDEVLYFTGFFGGHLATRGVPLGYVSTLGSTAYDRAAAMLRRGGAGAAPALFDELATKFTMFASLLNDVADALYAQSARDDRRILEVYERWLERRSGALADSLQAWGLIPLRGDGTVH